MRRMRTSGPYQRGLVLVSLGMGGVYRPLSSADVYRPTREPPLGDPLFGTVPFAVVRPSADRPFRWARPGPVFALAAMGHEDSHPRVTMRIATPGHYHPSNGR